MIIDCHGHFTTAPKTLHAWRKKQLDSIQTGECLAIDPAILLMDEPFSALDAQTREVLQAELLRIHAETAKTTLFVTHDLDEAIYLSDRVAVLAAKPGRVVQEIEIPFAHPRPELPELRGNLVFQKIGAHIWSLIRSSEAATQERRVLPERKNRQ
jgi:NitT/TauT family transport system ATP-binding protein